MVVIRWAGEAITACAKRHRLAASKSPILSENCRGDRSRGQDDTPADGRGRRAVAHRVTRDRATRQHINKQQENTDD